MKTLTSHCCGSLLPEILRVVAALAIFASPVMAEEGSSPCSRVVSFAPSITETLFSLVEEERIVGVTEYCAYPTRVRSITKVGGFLDPNFEAVLRLRPDLVVILKEQKEAARYLSRLGFAVLSVDHRSVTGILSSIEVIGERCQRVKEAKQLRSRLEQEISTIRELVSKRELIRTMVVVGRREHDSSTHGVFLSGRDGFYNEMLEIAGGENVYKGETASVPALSVEGIISLNPKVIIEILSQAGAGGVHEARVFESWDAIPYVDAVKQKRVFVFSEDYMGIPGPRFPQALRKIVAALHPDLRDTYDRPRS